MSDLKAMMEDYNSTLDDIWQFSLKFDFEPPFEAVICLIWTPPLTDRLNFWNLLVSNNTKIIIMYSLHQATNPDFSPPKNEFTEVQRAENWVCLTKIST